MKVVVLLLFAILPITTAFKSTALLSRRNTIQSSLIQSMSLPYESGQHPHCDLPGDPSLILHTNVDLGANKGDILKALSKLVASSTGKPESYVGKSFQVFYHLQYISISYLIGTTFST